MTVSRSFVTASIVLLCLAAAPRLQAQFRTEMQSAPPPGVLSPDPSLWWIGPQIGANINSHVGDFITDFCQCSFENGSGVGITAGIEVGHMFSPMFGFAAKIIYNNMNADYSYIIRQDAQVVGGGIVQADFERKNEVGLGYFMLNPVLQFYPFPVFYLFAGPAVGIKTAGNQTYTLRIADDRYEFAIGDPSTRIVEEDSGEIPGAEGLRMDFRAGLGANIRLGRSFLFSPEVSYNFPLTTISTDDNWKAEAIHLIGVFKFEL
ncbi:MAG: hypothetical protein WC824_12785 [Bacteroidota bacterium]|jgi:hypothetical protein